MRDTRRISWLKAARRSFEKFPDAVRLEMMAALTIAAEGRKTPKREIDLVRERIKRLEQEPTDG